MAILAVHGLGGELCKVWVNDVWTWSRVRTAISGQTRIPLAQMRLVVGAELLPPACDNDTFDLSLCGTGPGVTLFRCRPVKVDQLMSSAEWYAFYVHEYVKRPSASELKQFVQNRFGQMSFIEAKEAVALHQDPAVPLADLPHADVPAIADVAALEIKRSESHKTLSSQAHEEEQENEEGPDLQHHKIISLNPNMMTSVRRDDGLQLSFKG